MTDRPGELRAAQAGATSPGSARAAVRGTAARADLRALYDRHYRPLIVLAFLLGADDPEDIVAEAFTRLHFKARVLIDPAAAPAYLRKSVVNLSRNRVAHLVVVRRTVVPMEPDRPGADEAAIASVASRELLVELAALSPRHREALVLRFWLDLSEGQMAQVMGTSRGTVKAHVSRGLAALRKSLRDRGIDD